MKLLKWGILQNQFSHIASILIFRPLLKQANMFSLIGHSTVACFTYSSYHFLTKSDILTFSISSKEWEIQPLLFQMLLHDDVITNLQNRCCSILEY